LDEAAPVPALAAPAGGATTMSLRRRVVLGCLAVAIVLLVADVALAGAFRGFLLEQIDTGLTESAGRLLQFASDPDRPPPRLEGRGRGPGASGPQGPLSEFYLGVADRNGELVGRVDVPLRSDQAPPAPPASRVLAAATRPGEPLRPFTAEGADGAGWRVVALRSDEADEIILVGSSLAEVDPTYRRMLAVLVIATLAVFSMLAAVAWWVLRQGVRPLAAMTATAEAIAGGALHERVGDTDERTEAGRLGAALNTMLEETAFAEREQSEGRLRRFVADASHELRTPLTSIRGYAELYRAGGLADPDDLDGAMRRVEQEGRRMSALVEDLLLLAKLDQGRPLEHDPVDLAAIAADAVADLRALEPNRPVELETQPVEVIGDEARLRQAVANLVANVRIHTPPATPVWVRVSRDGAVAVIEVADQGPGMAPEVAGRVFERFYRADPARARSSGGLGLGLSIVAGVAEAHGGAAELDTAPGRGARFRLRLPRGGAASADAP
jgi:two-component system OmpR family sensor kinase